jgi:hypothetical protein
MVIQKAPYMRGFFDSVASKRFEKIVRQSCMTAERGAFLIPEEIL